MTKTGVGVTEVRKLFEVQTSEKLPRFLDFQ